MPGQVTLVELDLLDQTQPHKAIIETKWGVGSAADTIKIAALWYLSSGEVPLMFLARMPETADYKYFSCSNLPPPRTQPLLRAFMSVEGILMCE